MKTLQMQVVGVRNRKTVSDLKLKKTLTQDPEQQLLKITKTIKLKQPKLTPIIGQITIVPIKPQNALVKQMLLGKQAMKLQGPLRRLKFNTYAGTNNIVGDSTKNYQNYFNTTNKQYPESVADFVQDKDHNTLETKQQQYTNKIEEELISNHRQSESPKKIVSRIKTLPKIQNQSKYVSEKNEKIDRPLLSSLDANMKGIKALHFFILRHEEKIPIIAYRSKAKIQVASLTKIMTFYTVYKICQQFNIKYQEVQIKIQEEMTDISGTTASLVEGQIYTVEQLLYGMMLPSGNDASIALAVWGARILSKNSDKNSNIINQLKIFVEKMNLEVKQLKMLDSSFGNPHGLPHRNNRTTCEDMAKLCSICLEIPLFRQVVSTKIYKFKVYDPVHKKKVAFHWQNTNKLLRRPGFIGIKTGITVTAGPCLASAYQFLGKTYIVIIAKCNKPSRRFKQTRKLLKYCLQKINHEHELTKQQQTILKRLGKSNEDIDSDYSEEEAQFNFGTFTQEEIQRRARMLTLI